MDTAVWWMEYSIRHGTDKTLHSTLHEDTPWYQYHHVDVVAFAAAVLAAICVAVTLTLHMCCKFVCFRRKMKTE